MVTLMSSPISIDILIEEHRARIILRGRAGAATQQNDHREELRYLHGLPEC